MSPLFETIKVKDGQFFNLEFHHARMNATRKALFSCKENLDLKAKLYIPKSLGPQLHKCKVIYESDLISIHFQPYHIRKIESLKIIQEDTIDYTYKWTNRNHLNELYTKKANCDDVLIVKNGLITDTSYANIIFFDGKKWVTPRLPLLKGTKRALLLKTNKIEAADIQVNQLSRYKYAKIVNALLDINDTQPIEIRHISE